MDIWLDLFLFISLNSNENLKSFDFLNSFLIEYGILKLMWRKKFLQSFELCNVCVYIYLLVLEYFKDELVND